MKKLLVFIEREHMHNMYTGYDGASLLRDDLVASFGADNIAWAIPDVVLDESMNPQVDFNRIARVCAQHDIHFTEFMRRMNPTSLVGSKFNFERGALQNGDMINIINGNSGLNSTDAVVVFWRSRHFPEYSTMRALIDVVLKETEAPIFIYDTDLWLAEDVEADPSCRSLFDDPRVAFCRPYTTEPSFVKSAYVPYALTRRMLQKLKFFYEDRPFVMSYIGNDYDRRELLAQYFLPDYNPRQLAGNWARDKVKPWRGSMMKSSTFMKGVLQIQEDEFMGATPHAATPAHHSFSKFALYAHPDRYSTYGHLTLRFFEALSAGCLPIIPPEIKITDMRAHIREFIAAFGAQPSNVKNLMVKGVDLDALYEWALAHSNGMQPLSKIVQGD